MVIPVYENYKNYRPPRYVHSTIVKLLSSLSTRHLSGLRSVVLTNAGAIGKGKTARVSGKKYLREQCLGFYHPQKDGEAPWIEIVVDNIVATLESETPSIVTHIPMMRNFVFAETLFHEIGHHLERTIGASAPQGEKAAEAWKDRLAARFFRKRYWYLVPLVPIFRKLFAAAVRWRGLDPAPTAMNSRKIQKSS
jgi:hypothetical protein